MQHETYVKAAELRARIERLQRELAQLRREGYFGLSFGPFSTQIDMRLYPDVQQKVLAIIVEACTAQLRAAEAEFAAL